MASNHKTTVAIAVAAAVGVAAAVIYSRKRQQAASVDLPTSVASETTAAATAVAQEQVSSTAATAVGQEQVPSVTPNNNDAEKAARAEQANRAKERGNKRFAGRQYASAITEYTNAIALADAQDPESAKFYGNRAQCHACLEDHAAAEADCSAALSRDPKYVKALVRRANAREKQGKTEQAIVDFTGALLLSDMQNDAATEGVDRLVKQVAASKTEQRLKEPMHCLPSASFISTFVESFRGHRELLRKARPTIAELDKAVDGAADSTARATLLTERALQRMSARDYEAAMLDWGAAVALISPIGEAIGKQAGVQTPSPDQCRTTLQQWGKSGHDVTPATASSMLGMFLHLRGNYDDAMACYELALELNPRAIDTLLKRASLWFEKEDVAKAFADFDAALAIDTKHADIFCHRGQLHMLQNDLHKAVTDLEKSVMFDGDSVLAHIQLGMSYHRLKQTAEARSAFEKAETRFPSSPDVLNYFGEFLVEMGDLVEAKRKFQKVLDISDSSFALAYVNLGVLQLHSEQDMDGAVEKCAQAVKVDPLCETAHVHMAHLMLQKGNLSAAVAAFDDAIALLRAKQELQEAYAMREAGAAQLVLMEEQPEVYKPAMERLRAQQASLSGMA